MAGPRRTGFTFIEIIVAMAVLLIMGAALVPYVVGAIDKARVKRGGDSLEGLSEAIEIFNADVRTGTAKKPYPGRLSHLSSPIAGNSPTSRDVCGLMYTAANASTWGGPYINRTIPANGLPLSVGLAQDSLVASGPLIGIRVTDVSVEDALELNDRFDGDEGASDLSAGSVQWTVPDAQGKVTVTYYRPMAVC